MKLGPVFRVPLDAGNYEQVRVLSGDDARHRAQAEKRDETKMPTTEATEHTKTRDSHDALS